MTPAGMTFSTLAGIASGMSSPGVMGVGKYYLTSPKFISSDGGFKRIVWMSSVLKRSMAEEFQAVAEHRRRAGLDRSHRRRDCLHQRRWPVGLDGGAEHPALFMDPYF